MIYKSTKTNIIVLLRNLGTLSKEQIQRFFSDTTSIVSINNILNEMTIYNFLRYDDVKERYSYNASYLKVKDNIIDRRIDAFWVLANYGSSQITQVFVPEYPGTLSFITADNLLYDVTVCNSLSAAQLASMVLKTYIGNGIDNATHIAVVRDRSMEQQLREYGYDSYCIIDDKDHDSHYFTLD